jgi:ABC-type transport system involved in multi-copper enzyme maturation permease subunit
MTTAAIRADAQTVPSLAARALDLLAFEWTKLRSVRSNYVTLLIAAVATIGSTVVIAHGLASAPALPPGGPITALTASFLGYAEYAVLPVSVLAVLQFTSEYTTGLIRTTFAAAPRRWAVLTGKAAVSAAAALIFGEVLAFACFFLTQAILSGQHRGVSLTRPGVPGAVLAAGFVLCACTLTALGLGAIIRHTAGAIAATIAATYLVAALCLALPSPWKDDIGRFTMPFAASEVVALHPQAGLLSPAASMLVLIAWPAAALLAAGLVITRRDA